MAEPTGEVRIFLQTDIEGSTNLWERHPEAMRPALSRHDGILQALITHQGGQIVKATGDGALAWFLQSERALEAALAIQHVVGSASWGEIGTLRVRVGLHAGEAQHRDLDFFGQTINRLARLLALAQGGQIIVSATIVQQLNGRLPDGIRLIDLGAVTLRDVPVPIQAYLIDPTGTPSGPAATTAVMAEELPVPAESEPPAATTPASASPPPVRTLRVYTLGEFRVECNGREIPADSWGRTKGRQIFKYLITRRTRRVPRDELFNVFFTDSQESTVRTTLLRLRNILEPDRGNRESMLLSGGDVLRFDPAVEVWIDADEFERLIRESRTAEDPLPLLEAASELYGGEYLPDDPFEEWARNRREALRQLHTDLLRDLSGLREARGDVRGAAEALQTLLAKDGCDEQTARELMLLRARHGDVGEALRVFQRLTESLRHVLESEPSSETVALRDQIARGEVKVVPTVPPEQVLPERAQEAREPDRPEPPAHASPPIVPISVPLPLPARTPARSLSEPPRPHVPTYRFPTPDLLVGRQRETLLLRQTLERGRTSGQIVTIGAPAGNGKSTLTGALVEHARTRGFLTLAGGSYDREGVIPFGPIRDALADYLLTQDKAAVAELLVGITRELAQVVPALGPYLGLPDDRDAPAIEARFLTGAISTVLQRLGQRQPVLLCLEDLHAADGATIGLLHILAHQIGREPIVVLGTYRAEELQPGDATTRTLTSLIREGLAQHIALGPLGQQETADLVTSLLDGPPSTDLSAALYQVSEGNPLFVEQLVLSLQEDGRVQQRGGVWHDVGDGGSRLPPIIREVIELRFARLSPRCREVLEVAAAIGQTFDLRVLIGSQRERDYELVILDLDEAIRAQVVEEVTGGFAFGHAMLREALYRGMSSPLRALVHARVGAAIERVAGSRVAERAAELAYHFRLAADVAPTAGKAVRYSLEAGRRAVALSAHREALLHFTRACDTIERETDTLSELDLPTDAHVEALEGRAWAERQLGMWLACITSCQLLLELSDDPMRRASMRSMLCRALRSLGDTQRSMIEAEAGLAELATVEETPEVARARIRLMYDRAFLCHLAGRFREVEAVGRDMLALAERHDLTGSEFLPFSIVALACMHQGRDAETVTFYQRAISAAEQAHDVLGQAVFTENLGKQHHQAGRFSEAQRDLDRSVRLYKEAVAGPRAVNALHWLARVELSRGDVDAAHRQAELALSRAVDGQDRWAAECHDVLGAIHSIRSSWEEAEASYGRALAIRERVAHADGIVESLVGLATIAERQGDWAKAEQHALRAFGVAQSIDPCPDRARPARLLGRLYGRRGDVERADHYLTSTLALVELMAPTLELAPTLLAVAEEQVRLATGPTGTPTNPESAAIPVVQALRMSATAEVTVEVYAFAASLPAGTAAHDEAARTSETARELARRSGAPRLHGLERLAAGRHAARRGNLAAATDAFERAMSLLERAGCPYDLGLAAFEYGTLLLGPAGREERGRALLTTAALTFERLGARPDAERCRQVLSTPRPA